MWVKKNTRTSEPSFFSYMNKESHSSVQKFKSAFCLNILMEPIATLPDNLILQHRNSLKKLKKINIKSLVTKNNLL